MEQKISETQTVVADSERNASSASAANDKHEEPENVATANSSATTNKKKKNKAKSAVQQPAAQQANDDADGNVTAATSAKAASEERVKGLQKALEMLAWHSSGGAGTSARSLDEARSRSYAFWSTQPVPRIADRVDEGTNEAIEPDRPIDEVRADPYTLPAEFRWDTLKLSDQAQLDELYTLLTENYVEDDDCMFRFDYGRDFLRWALHPPEWREDWHCGVRVNKSGRLVGFISAVPCTTRLYTAEKRLVEINFLCVHKKLRSKRMAPVLIREITRRVNRTGLFQAVYTAGAYLPKPVGTCRYWHRSLNPKKLVECRFSHLGKNMTMQRTIKLYKLPDAPKLDNFRKMTTKSEVHSAWQLVAQYLQRFDLAPVFSKEEFEHWMLPREDIVDSFVATGANGEVTDFVSFYTLSSSVMNNPQHKSIKAAYLFYYASRAHMNSLQAAKRIKELESGATAEKGEESVAELKRIVEEGNERLVTLLNDALVCARQRNFDVFNALDLMDNRTFLERLKFGVGDGNLNYYVYNWRCPQMNAEQIAVVLQ